MRFILKFGLFLTIILTATSILLPPAYGLTFPRHPGPVVKINLRLDHLDYIEANQPEIALLGDSTLASGIDPEALAAQTGKSVYRISVPGSASALWYLILKNNIIDAEPKPNYVLIVFRDSMLTAPGYRVQGSYYELLDEFAQQNEPVLVEKSFTNLMNPLELAADKYFPLYAVRTDIRRKFDAGIRYLTPLLFGCDRNCVDYSLGEIFSGGDMEPGALVDAVNAAETYIYTPEQLNFEKQVERSYLPDMIDLAKENGIELVFVRIKVESADASKDPRLAAYLESLRAYLKEQDVPLLDYGADPRLTHEMYQDVIHLNDRGKVTFTQMVAEGMLELFKEK